MDTLSYYSQKAKEYVADTISVDFSSTQEKFLKKLRSGASILDFGCGSGRDSKYFLDKGFKVVATDGCQEFVDIASEYTGLNVQKMLFQELDDVDRYDGIWACASILHLPKIELVDVIAKIYKALKKGGYLYTSFKYGEFEGMRNGRYFTYMTEERIKQLLEETPYFKIDEQWISEDVREGRKDEKWLNLILKKE